MVLSFRLSQLQQGRKKRLKREIHPWEFPEDLVMEILLRLPAKSLMRFKCVSKLWSSLISSHFFSNRFLTLPTPRLYICLVDHSSYHNSVIMSLAQDTTTTLSSFIVDHDMTIPHRRGIIFQSLCGFMCYYFLKTLRIYNPATRQLVTLPPVQSDIHRSTYVYYYFGHDPISNQYKVLCLIQPQLVRIPEHWVYSLKPGGGSWKKLEVPNLFPYLGYNQLLCINWRRGLVYYMACCINMHHPVLVSFDIKSEEFKSIQLPYSYSDGDELSKRLYISCLVEYSRKVALFDPTHLKDKGMVDLWVLEDAVKKEWSSKTLVLPSSQLHLVNKVNNNTLRKIVATQNGKLLLLPTDLVSPFHILCYDLQSNDMRKIEVKGIPDHWFSKDKCHFDVMFLDQSDNIISLET